SQIAQILQEKKIIRNAAVFNFWLKRHSVTNFQAGNNYLSPSMHKKEIVSQLQGGGGRPVVGHVLIKEGQTIDSIATTVGKNTKYSRQDFLKLMKDKIGRASCRESEYSKVSAAFNSE